MEGKILIVCGAVPSTETLRRMVSTFPSDDAVMAEGEGWRDVLPFEKSAHNSATIVVPSTATNSIYDRETFRTRLDNTCQMLRDLNKSSVWVEVPMSRASLIEEMSCLGFQHHHAQGSTANLNLWLRIYGFVKSPHPKYPVASKLPNDFDNVCATW